MTQPLALVLYEKLLPGTQVVNRLQDLKYRVQTISDPDALVQTAETIKPLVVLADLESTRKSVCSVLARLKENAATRHLPVIAFGGEAIDGLHGQAKEAGATLIVGEAAILNHLPILLEQALQIE